MSTARTATARRPSSAGTYGTARGPRVAGRGGAAGGSVSVLVRVAPVAPVQRSCRASVRRPRHAKVSLLLAWWFRPVDVDEAVDQERGVGGRSLEADPGADEPVEDRIGEGVATAAAQQQRAVPGVEHDGVVIALGAGADSAAHDVAD